MSVYVDSNKVQVILGAKPILREKEGCLEITLLHYPDAEEWEECKLRALVTQGFTRVKTSPDAAWKHDMLTQRHSPIRVLRYSFMLKGVPSNIATHFSRHKHAEPYIGSLRNDRQQKIDGDNAPRNTPVNMIIDMNAEELMVFSNKRLCNLAYLRTKEIASEMLYLAEIATPELRGLLVPACIYNGNKCHERDGCGMCPKWEA